MIIVHDIFVCKPGNASKAAKAFKEMMAPDKNFVSVMTDLTGQFHRVVMVTQYESLCDFEKMMEKHQNPTEEMKQQMAKLGNFQDMYLSGSREIYRLW